MTMTPKELVKLLKKDGWIEIKQEGSHLKIRKSGYNDIIIPIHNRDMKKGLLNKILKQAGL